ncbi:Proteasome subunit alpha type-2, partial [Kappamyces sp. JEL0680]
MDFPKPLFPIAGHPIIFHHVAALSKIAGMKEIFLIGFFDQSVFDGFLKEMQAEFPYIIIRYLREYQSMGTAGGIHHFRDEILKGSPDAFFVLNGDIASSFPLQEMLSTHKKCKGTATILSIRMDKKKLSRFGCIVIDESTLQVQHFVEKPQTFVSDLISCGVYIFGKDVFSSITVAADARRAYEAENGIDISQFEHKASLAASNAALSRIADRVQLEDDLLPLLAAQKTVYAHVMSYDDFWMPIKTGSSTITANRLYLQYFLQAQPRRLSTPHVQLTSPTS